MFKILTEVNILKCPRMLIAPFSTACNFRTGQNDPREHTKDQLAQFYTVSPDIRKQLFLYGGIPKSYDVQTKTFTETCLMVRNPALDIINCIKSNDWSRPMIRFVLYGKKGSGKSLSLANVLHFGLKSGFLLLHVPWVGGWTRRPKEYSNSNTKEGCVDLNIDAAAWLLHFKNQNSHLLSDPNLVTAEECVWSKRETTAAEAPLSELIDHGINRVKYASDCVTVLCREVKRLTKEGKCKTLVAIDGFNGLFYPNTRVFTDKKEMVPPGRITLLEGFFDVTKNDWNNAVSILTVDEIAAAETDQLSHFPKYLLGKSGFEHIDPFIPIEVKGYNKKEFTSCMDYYRERKWVQPLPGMDDELSFLSASNPYNLMQLCAPL